MAARGAAGVLVLVLACLSGSCWGIRLKGNGYQDLLVAINPAVPENPLLIERIKEMLTKGSSYLHKATGHKLYLENVTILVPPSWAGTYSRATGEAYDQANVVVDEPNKLYGHSPYVLQYGECGAPSQYMHFTPDFLLNDNLLRLYGPRERLFVHEWSHLRWGVYDEYDTSQLFYLQGGELQATRCSEDVQGKVRRRSNPTLDCDIDPQTGLPTADCSFYVLRKQQAKASIMFLQSLDSVDSFCNKETHNIWAPNKQNRMCDQMSVEEVISTRSVDSSVYKELLPVEVPPPVEISVVQRQPRVVCLVLDVSGSMFGFRITGQHQAASLFLEQIVEEQATVAIVTFSSQAYVVKPLTLIQGPDTRKALVDALPTLANGGTEICLGLEKGLEELSRDGNTQGDEIIFLTDGESNSPMNCLGRVEQSGVVVYTIALGDKADKQLEQMAEASGGHFLLASDSLDSNELVDVFASFVTTDGDLSKQTIQLESVGSRISSGWFNGSVSVDRTIGNNTSFLILYESSPITILVHSPDAVTYDTSSFTHQAALKSYKLNIPGTAKAGTWSYGLLNGGAAQAMSLTVTSQASSAGVAPVLVRAHINQLASDGSKPLVVYAAVHQGGVPVALAVVTARLLSESGNSYDLDLLDNGAGADAFRNDGIYSRYFIPIESGRYSLKVKVHSDDGKAKFSSGGHSGAYYIPGYVEEDGTIVANPPDPSVSEDNQQADVGNFSRTAIGDSFSVDINPSVPQPAFPPNKITDLSARLENSTVWLAWTAPGEHLDVGTAAAYEIRFSRDPRLLRANFSEAAAVNTSSLRPRPSGSAQRLSFPSDVDAGDTLFLAVRARGGQGALSELSNLAQITGPEPVSPSACPPGGRGAPLRCLAIAVAAVCTVMLACG